MEEFVMRSYEAARSLFSFLAFIAWSTVAIGVLVALISAEGVSRYAGDGAGLLAMVPGIGIGITGLVLVAFVQMGRANVDTAEYTQQMLKISRDQLEVSKQALKRQNTLPQSFEAVAKVHPNAASASFSGTESNAGPGNDVPFLGQRIVIEGSSFLYNGKPFLTLQAAKNFIEEEIYAPTTKEPSRYKS
jgi:hypothetical protein